MSVVMTVPIHTPVLLRETLEALQVQPGKHYVDCTLGSGGHTTAILHECLPNGRVLGIDADPEALKIAETRLADYAQSTILIQGNFADLEAICKENDFLPVHGILLDLGISSIQVTFLALRIAVNRELENLVTALRQTINCLDHQGRLVVISYHSLEDRVVKQFMRQETKGCLCPPGTPVCKCGHTPSMKLISRKVITPSLSEIQSNARSRSAKLRVAERL